MPNIQVPKPLSPWLVRTFGQDSVELVLRPCCLGRGFKRDEGVSGRTSTAIILVCMSSIHRIKGREGSTVHVKGRAGGIVLANFVFQMRESSTASRTLMTGSRTRVPIWPNIDCKVRCLVCQKAAVDDTRLRTARSLGVTS